MIKVKALREFTYGDFDKIKNLERYNKEQDKKGTLYAKDTFECNRGMADYLTGGCGYELVKVIEVIPEETKEEPKIEDAEVEFPEEEPKELKATVKKTKKAKRK